MSHLSEYSDGSDSSILMLIENSARASLYSMDNTIGNIPIESSDEIIALEKMILEMIDSNRGQFVKEIEWGRSTAALYCAYRVRFLNVLSDQLIKLAKKKEGTDFVKHLGW